MNEWTNEVRLLLGNNIKLYLFYERTRNEYTKPINNQAINQVIKSYY